jgi:prepilin-type N-terminal cleavage/methylation domain-containing protein
VRVARKGFTLVEMLIVVVIIGGLTLFSIPKFAVLQERSKLTSARQEIEAALVTARAAAIQKGRVAKLHIANNKLSVTVIPVGGGVEQTVLPVMPLDSVYGITMTVTDTLIVFDVRGFASPRLAATGMFKLIGRTRRDSVCISTTGQILSRGCAL